MKNEYHIYSKRGREYYGEIIESALCIKKNGSVLYYRKGRNYLNLSEDKSVGKFFQINDDGSLLLVLEKEKGNTSYLIIDIRDEKLYDLGYFQDSSRLSLIRDFSRIKREDILLAIESVSSRDINDDYRDKFEKGFISRIANPWISFSNQISF